MVTTSDVFVSCFQGQDTRPVFYLRACKRALARAMAERTRPAKRVKQESADESGVASILAQITAMEEAVAALEQRELAASSQALPTA